jgi:hypothetical protein
VWPLAELAARAAKALRGSKDPGAWEGLAAAAWTAGLQPGADLLLPELYALRRSDHEKVLACVEWLLDMVRGSSGGDSESTRRRLTPGRRVQCDARPELVLVLAQRPAMFPADEDRATDWIFRFLERFPRVRLGVGALSRHPEPTTLCVAGARRWVGVLAVWMGWGSD